MMIMMMMMMMMMICQTKTINDFNFNAWKKRYSDWNHSHYLRLTDVFRNQVSSRAETLTRKEFIEGILSTSTTMSIYADAIVDAVAALMAGIFLIFSYVWFNCVCDSCVLSVVFNKDLCC